MRLITFAGLLALCLRLVSSPARAPIAHGPLLRHRTGSVTRAGPVNIIWPTPSSAPSLYDPVLLFSPTYFTGTEPAFPYAVDAAGKPL